MKIALVLTMLLGLGSCSKLKNAANTNTNTIRPDNSETDPDWFGLRFSSASIELGFSVFIEITTVMNTCKIVSCSKRLKFFRH